MRSLVLFSAITFSAVVASSGQVKRPMTFEDLQQIKRVEKAYERFGFLAIGIPAILPPPLPFKIFVATAGALEYPRWKFLLTVMIARSFRYYVEGILAVFYGRRVLLFLKDNGLMIVSIVGALVLVGAIVYLVVNRRNRTSARATDVESVGAENGVEGPVDPERPTD